MSAPLTSAFDLLRQVPGDLLKVDEIPLLGFSPTFPFQEVSGILTTSLQLESLEIEASPTHWRSQEDLFNGLGDRLQTIQLAIAPLDGTVFWVMPEKDLAVLMTQLLLKQSQSRSAIEPDFLLAFYRFIALEVCNAVEKSGFDKKLSFEIKEDGSLPNGNALTSDICITLDDQHYQARLFLTPEFRNSWTKRYNTPPKDYYLTSPLSERIQLIIHLEAGKVQLTMKEWKQIRPGDFIVLDSCSLEAGEDKGRVMMTINGVPFFRGRVKQGSIKILEHPLYHEVNTVMNKNGDDDESEYDDESEEFTDEEFDDLESETEETTETDLGDESEFDHDESDFSDLEESEIEEAPPKKGESPKKGKTPDSLKGEPQKAGVAAKTVEEIPLPVVVEVGRLQMSVKKLMELQPGNMLELDVHPESGVDLVVNGRRVAKGELLRVGEALGVRILELT